MRRCPDCQQPATPSGFCAVCQQARDDLALERNREWFE